MSDITQDLITADDLRRMHSLQRVTVVSTTPYQAKATDDLVLVNTTAGVTTVTLPLAASTKGGVVVLERYAGSNNLLIAPMGADQINGSVTAVTVTTSYTPYRYKSVLLGGTWTWVSI